MSAFNAGRVLTGAKVTLRTREVVVGCRDEGEGGDGSEVRVFVPGAPLARSFGREEVVSVEEFALPEAPECAYEVRYQKTGGVSSSGTSHDAFHRRHVVAGEPQRGRAAVVAVDPPLQALEEFLRSHPRVQFGREDTDEEGTRLVTLTTPGELVAHTIFAAAREHGLECVSLARRQPTILCDTLFRAVHTYAQQTKVAPMHAVGPTRDMWRFCMEHVPRWWLARHLAPFTWEGYGRMALCATPSHRVGELPYPLRPIALREGMAACDELARGHARASASLAAQAQAAGREAEGHRLESARLGSRLRVLRRRLFPDVGRRAIEREMLERARAEADASRASCLRARGKALERCDAHAWSVREAARAAPSLRAAQPPPGRLRLRCPALNEAQQAQCMHLFHCLQYGLDLLTSDEASASRAALLQLALGNGTVPRMVTVYEKTGWHAAYGEELRDRPEDEASMPAAVRNRCRVRDGRLVGAGGQGCKGIMYAPKPGQAVYRPLHQRTRDLADNAHLKRKRI